MTPQYFFDKPFRILIDKYKVTGVGIYGIAPRYEINVCLTEIYVINFCILENLRGQYVINSIFICTDN